MSKHDTVNFVNKIKWLFKEYGVLNVTEVFLFDVSEKRVQNGFRILITLRICTQLKNVIFRIGKLQGPQAFIGINMILNALLYYSLSSFCRNNEFQKKDAL